MYVLIQYTFMFFKTKQDRVDVRTEKKKEGKEGRIERKREVKEERDKEG